MSQIQIPNIRTGTDVPMEVRLTDSGVRIDWATLDNIAAYIYSEAQMVIAGKCSDIHVDPEDNTALLVEYPYTENQFLGVQSLVIVADYQGQHCTFDRKAFCFVATTDETGESTTVEDDTVEVDITVDDVDSSILSAAIRAALEAADLAEEKSDAANDAAILANEKAGFAEEQGEYAKAQGDYAKEQIDEAKGEYQTLDGRFDAMEETIPNDIIRTASDASFVHHTSARNTHLFYLREATTLLAGLMTASDKVKLSALPTAEELSAAILAITNLIPAQASAENQLADKAFVNSSISTATATFRGTFNLVSDLHLTISASQSDIAAALASAISDADNNDYAFVQIPTKNTKPNEIARIDRYKYNGTSWSFEYSLNNSSFTEAQWAALNSGITSAAVAKLSALPTMSELEALLGGKVNISDIVDDLLSNESSKPLSAKQGKVLAGKVSQLGRKVVEIEGWKSAVTGWVSGQYIVNNQSVGSTCPKQVVTGQSSWRSVIVAVPPYADKYIINGEGGSTPRLWSFLDSNDVVLALSVQSAIGTNDALKVNVPTGATQLIINSKTSEDCYEIVEGLIPPIQADVTALLNDVDGLSEEVKEQGTDIDTIPYVCEGVDKFALNANPVTKSVSLSANTRYLVKLHYFGLSATDLQRMNKLVFVKSSSDILSINFSDIQNDEVYITPSSDIDTVKVTLLATFVRSAEKKMSIDIITCNNEDVPITKWDKAIKDNIEDSLKSSSSENSLAARQGKILAKRIAEQDYGLDFSRDYNIVNTIGMSWTPNGEIKTNGTIVSNNNKSVSDYIAIDATKGYLYLGISLAIQYYDETNQQNVIASAAPLDKSRYCFYDKDKTVISTVVNSDFSKEIPINAAFVRITASTIYRDFARLIYGNYNETIKSRQVDYRLTLQDTFKFSPTGYERLKMVAFGDSLTHGRFDGVTGKPQESWPDYANDELRSNIINCGFGGTRMTGNSLFCFYKLCETIVSEDADKWDDYDAYVVDNPDFAYNLNTLKNIDWATVDAISVWYGANDYPSNIPIGQSYNEDESTFDGACIKGIKMLLQKYPHLQVLVLSPIWGIRGGKNVDYETNTEGLTMPDYVNAIKRVSERLHIPVVDMYHTFQFNDINKLVYSSDETHIRSNAGFKRLAHTIVEQIKLYIVPKDL